MQLINSFPIIVFFMLFALYSSPALAADTSLHSTAADEVSSDSATRLFDSPHIESGVFTEQQPLRPKAAPKQVTRKSIFFNGVVVQQGVVDVWIENLPLSLWQQNQQEVEAHWDTDNSVLLLRIGSDTEVQLKPGQTLYQFSNGSLQVKDISN